MLSRMPLRRSSIRPAAHAAMILAVLGVFACSLFEGSPEEDADDDDDTSGCEDGAVLQCIGPQGCSGLTLCQDGRTGECICGVGGASGAGGTSPNGGSPSGGVSGTGNQGGTSSGNGGTTPTGGTGGSIPNMCPTTFQVYPGGYVAAPGANCWSGYAYTSASATATIAPASFESCGAPCQLCVSGSVPATADYSAYALLGMNTQQPPDNAYIGGASPNGPTLTIGFTTRVSSPLRVNLVTTDPTDITRDLVYCYDVPTGAASPLVISWTSFNTQCWNGMGMQYSNQAIKGVQLFVPGGNTVAVPFDFCLTLVRVG